MTLQQILSVPIIIQRAGPTADRYGNANIDWAHATSTTAYGWLDTNLRRMAEDDKNRDEVESDGSCFLPGTTDVKGTDRLVINGSVYQVWGEPAPVYRPGWPGVHHIECRIKRYQG